MLRLASVLAALVLMLSPAVAQPLDDPHHPCNGCAVPAEPDLPDPGEVDDVTPDPDADRDTDEAFEEDHLWDVEPQP